MQDRDKRNRDERIKINQEKMIVLKVVQIKEDLSHQRNIHPNLIINQIVNYLTEINNE